MTLKLAIPECTLATMQFAIDQRLMDFIWANDEAIAKFRNWMLKVPGLQSATFHPFMGLFVWCSFIEPHGKLILSHEVARDRIALFQRTFIEEPANDRKKAQTVG